jgi:GNAT superfamily N-acetyltransferase
MKLAAPLSLHEVDIRPAALPDVAALVNLIAELGYTTDRQVLAERLAALVTAGDAALVAEHQTEVIGFVQLHRTFFLHRPPDGRIVTLVVTAAYRSQGLGKLLLAAAEQAFLDWGCGRVEVSSGAQREAAHRFYQQAGYLEQPKRFVKQVLT